LLNKRKTKEKKRKEKKRMEATDDQMARPFECTTTADVIYSLGTPFKFHPSMTSLKLNKGKVLLLLLLMR